MSRNGLPCTVVSPGLVVAASRGTPALPRAGLEAEYFDPAPGYDQDELSSDQHWICLVQQQQGPDQQTEAADTSKGISAWKAEDTLSLFDAVEGDQCYGHAMP